VAFVTSSEFPLGTPDDALAVEELARRSVRVLPAIWNSDEVDWPSFDLIVLRSPWDYPAKREEFLRWVDRTGAVVPFWNPPAMIAWNSHKGYLLDLARGGAATVPTELVRRDAETTVDEIRQARGWNEIVVKPAVSSSSQGLLRSRPGDGGTGERHLRKLVAAGDALVQPYIAPARERGERSLVFFNGQFAFAVDYAYVLENDPRRPTPAAAAAEQVRTAEAILQQLDTVPLYARVDFLPSSEGAWLLGELELIEPELLLRGHPEAARKFADAIVEKLAQGGRSAGR
jgi:glutathione synthase/RimK-type ligase-like ATP-grasp enzyme